MKTSCAPHKLTLSNTVDWNCILVCYTTYSKSLNATTNSYTKLITYWLLGFILPNNCEVFRVFSPPNLNNLIIPHCTTMFTIDITLFHLGWCLAKMSLMLWWWSPSVCEVHLCRIPLILSLCIWWPMRSDLSRSFTETWIIQFDKQNMIERLDEYV